MLSWRFAFWGESVLMLPCAFIGFASANAHLKGVHIMISYYFHFPLPLKKLIELVLPTRSRF